MATSNNVLISVQNLVKEYNHGAVHALNDCNLEIRKGEVVAIIGPSGSGKSTLLRSLNLLEQPTSGAIFFDGADLAGKSVNIDLHRQKMGMVFQHFNLFPHMTILRNMTLAPVKLLHKPREEAEAQALKLLQRVGLGDRGNAYPAQLSGGQKQRVAIARMLTKKTPVIVFDDSLSAVDTETDEKIRSALDRDLGGATTIIISHRITTLLDCDNILVLEKGRVSQLGSPKELLAQPGIFRKIYDMQMSIGEEEGA